MLHPKPGVSGLSLIIGIDEAGRGPVMGPLVVAGVAISNEEPLRRLGVRDSKQLSPARRETLAPEIRKVASYELIALEAEDIDALRSQMSLNDIEARLFANVLQALIIAAQIENTGRGPLAGEPDNPVIAYLDAASSNAAAFGSQVRAGLMGELERDIALKIVSQHKADARYPSVAAASILAKVARDEAIDRLEEQLGCRVGSGYPSDPATQEFIKGYWREHGRLPPATRASWKTVNRLLKPQASLTDFGGRVES